MPEHVVEEEAHVGTGHVDDDNVARELDDQEYGVIKGFYPKETPFVERHSYVAGDVLVALNTLALDNELHQFENFDLAMEYQPGTTFECHLLWEDAAIIETPLSTGLKITTYDKQENRVTVTLSISITKFDMRSHLFPGQTVHANGQVFNRKKTKAIDYARTHGC